MDVGGRAHVLGLGLGPITEVDDVDGRQVGEYFAAVQGALDRV